MQEFVIALDPASGEDEAIVYLLGPDGLMFFAGGKSQTIQFSAACDPASWGKPIDPPRAPRQNKLPWYRQNERKIR
jgi:hypothetical protein